MPADRLLNTLLQRYRDVHDAATTDQIVGTTAHLLARLSNPLNLGILTSQLLTAPAIWHRQDGSKTAMRIIGIYKTAASKVRAGNVDVGEVRRLGCDEWARAVVKGADDGSPPWRHLLVLTGVLLGMETGDGSCLSWRLGRALQQAVVVAANLALRNVGRDGPMAAVSIVTALIFAFPILSDGNRASIDHDALLPIAVGVITGDEGFCDGRFLAAVGRDTVVNASGLLSWPLNSPSHRLVQELQGRNMMVNMGPLSKLAAFATQHAPTSAVVLRAHEALLRFTGRVLEAWRGNPLSGIDPEDDKGRMSVETQQMTWPLLSGVLRKLMYGSVAVLQAIVSRSLVDRAMMGDDVAPGVAARSLHVLRNLFFISSRDGNSSFEVYTFSHLASIDVLTRYPMETRSFLLSLWQDGVGMAPASHLERILDLFYLNFSEHVPLVLSTATCETFIVKPAEAYISHQGPMSSTIGDLFESGHSAVLSVLSCPRHSRLTMEMAPLYMAKLFESFPCHISARQFRVAFQTIMEMVSPPFPIAGLRPDLSETLLEMLRSVMASASNVPLENSSRRRVTSLAGQDGFSERSALVMTLVDSLPFLPLPIVGEWLTIAARSMNDIDDEALRAPVRDRFLDVLANGDLDVERAAVAVAWWGTGGGREAVLSGNSMMSGAIVVGETQSRL
ncbi:hypothetical protein CDD80_3669 [Ophiocordyceps camponoti-rufipedis]|uniref:Peroxisomal membrane protein PEX17 n=1 Tax=Ophiocordyceps camponoti-rufipedis TaxID=2004952 RepID=A0A2C5YVP7_9HYPO|nr:hypothetical protein CDD80_3669 [Ophiocordyceps camponoti-rufipedis]